MGGEVSNSWDLEGWVEVLGGLETACLELRDGPKDSEGRLEVCRRGVACWDDDSTVETER